MEGWNGYGTYEKWRWNGLFNIAVGGWWRGSCKKSNNVGGERVETVLSTQGGSAEKRQELMTSQIWIGATFIPIYAQYVWCLMSKTCLDTWEGSTCQMLQRGNRKFASVATHVVNSLLLSNPVWMNVPIMYCTYIKHRSRGSKKFAPVTTRLISSLLLPSPLLYWVYWV